jgi:hypothetical protein
VAAAPRGYLWWALLVVPLWAVLIACTYWEPVMRDGWGHLFWQRDNPHDLHTIYQKALEAYRSENPRLGQLLTLLAYTPGPYHVIITPIVELAMFGLLTAVALGRMPSVRRADDALVAAMVTAAILVCVPQIGAMLFYRPFAGNYTLGFTLNLLWLVPYRFELGAPHPGRRWWLAPVMLVVGLAAGLCNEHTGIAFLAMGALATLAVWRRGVRIWMLVGLVGLAAGFVLLLEAPGQHVRYAGLADQAGVVERITERGLAGNLAVIGSLALAVTGLLPLVVIGLVERSRGQPVAQPAPVRLAPLVLALAGVVCTLTLLASPKIGPRLYLASVALVVAAVVGWLAVQLHSAWARRLCGGLAAAAAIYVCARFVIIHHTVGPLGVARLATLDRAAPQTVVTVPRYPYRASRYFLGDDFVSPELRDQLRFSFNLKALELEPAR